MAGRPKGIPKTGGRVKGKPNKATAAKVAAVESSGLTPLEFMLSMMRDETQSEENRKWAADKAAPYVHSKLAAIEHTGEGGGPIKASIKVTFVKPGT